MFAKVCKAEELKKLEWFAYKHTEFFKAKGWDTAKNPKITIMVNAIKARGGTVPEDYVPKEKTGRRSRPRGQTRRHDNSNNGQNQGGAKGAAPRFNRRNQTGTPTDALPSAAV